MLTMPVNSWVSSAGVRLQGRAPASPMATYPSASAVTIPITVSAMPLLV